ncbi:MAG: integrase core domain-containing protein [Alphaproteobacteria bacterium]
MALHRPREPYQNAFSEEFNGLLRDEWLIETLFDSMAEAERIIEEWRIDSDTSRPHGATGDQTPAAFAAASDHAKQQGEALR